MARFPVRLLFDTIEEATVGPLYATMLYNAERPRTRAEWQHVDSRAGRLAAALAAVAGAFTKGSK